MSKLFCLQCIKDEEYDKKGKCRVCGNLIKTDNNLDRTLVAYSHQLILSVFNELASLTPDTKRKIDLLFEQLKEENL